MNKQHRWIVGLFLGFGLAAFIGCGSSLVDENSGSNSGATGTFVEALSLTVSPSSGLSVGDIVNVSGTCSPDGASVPLTLTGVSPATGSCTCSSGMVSCPTYTVTGSAPVTVSGTTPAGAVSASAALVASCGGIAMASPTDHYVFNTAGTYQPGTDFNGIAAADQICNDEAIAGGCVGTYKALMSTVAEPANTRVVDNGGAVVVFDGSTYTPFVADIATLFNISGTITAFEILTPGGGFGTGSSIWTGSVESGGSNAGNDCNAWTSSLVSDTGAVGDRDPIRPGDAFEIGGTGTSCDTALPIRCISQ